VREIIVSTSNRNVCGEPMPIPNPVQVLLWDMPPLLLEIVAGALAARPDLQVVASPTPVESLLKAVNRTNADVVVTSDRNSRGKEYDDLLYTHSRLKILEVNRNGHGRLHELHLRRVALGEMSPLELANVVCALARPTQHPGADHSAGMRTKVAPAARKSLELKE